MSLSDQLDDAQRSDLVRDELTSGYIGDADRMSSIVLAIVTLRDEIIVQNAS